jgi:hypothetical protein
MYKDNEDTIILILVQLNRILRVQRHSLRRSLSMTDGCRPTNNCTYRCGKQAENVGSKNGRPAVGKFVMDVELAFWMPSRRKIKRTAPM